MQKRTVDIAVAYGDGIGPEIMSATLAILKEVGADLTLHEIEVGEKVYLRGFKTGIEPQSWETLRTTAAFLKAPIATPQGGGFRSLNVTIRGALGLYANVRPCIAYYPIVSTNHPGMNVVIIRENEEDLYTGIEYRPTNQTMHALKVITKRGCEKIIHYAFEYARANKRKKVTCFTKDNILKITDGLFHKTFDEIAKEYPDITPEHWIVDIGAAKLTDTPEAFDVIVTPNLYGDILSDIAAQIAGSVGLAGSANIGASSAMFEAVHGSAPRRAGQNVANPSGLLLAAVMMLVHLEQFDIAEHIHNGWLHTLEKGIHTYDIFEEGKSKQRVGTKEFAQAVIANLGKKPETFPAVAYTATKQKTSHSAVNTVHEEKKLVGIDIFIEWKKPVEDLVHILKALAEQSPLQLKHVASRGLVVWPTHFIPPGGGEHLQCRFMTKESTTSIETLKLIKTLVEAHLDITQTQHLYYFGTTPGFSHEEAVQ